MSTPRDRKVSELSRRLRAYMGYADRTLEEVSAALQAAGVSASPSTVNRWARGLSVPNVFAAQALGRLVEEAGLAAPGEGTRWLLGEGLAVDAASAQGALDAAARSWHLRSADPGLADALAERGVPAVYRRPLAELLARLLEQLDHSQPDPPRPDVGAPKASPDVGERADP